MKYSELVNLYENLSKTNKRLEKTEMISNFLKKCKNEELDQVTTLIKGKIFPDWDTTEYGISTKIILKAISRASGSDLKEIEETWKKEGDLGNTIQSILKKKQQMSLIPLNLTISELINSLKNITTNEGEGSTELKIKLISRLLTSATPIEAKYIIRTILEDMRIGTNDGILKDSIAWAFLSNKKIKENKEEYNQIMKDLQTAIDLTNDYSKIIKIAKNEGIEGIKKVEIEIGKPLKLMLFPKANDLKEAFKNLGENIAFEYKYDGFRIQIHKMKDDIKIFTRRLDDVSTQFPDVIKAVKKHVLTTNCILDAEVVGYNPQNKKYMPFQSISQRIKRKYNIEEIARKFPVEINIFDIILKDEKNLTKYPFHERREILENFIDEEEKKIKLSKQIITNKIEKAEEFYKESLNQGFEGIMAKSLKAIYTPGRRVGSGFKLKPIMEELDLVITEAEWGNGKRSEWLTSFTLSCFSNNELVTIGKVSSGLKELEIEGLSYSKITELLKPIIINEKGKEIIVKPEIILEIHYEEIQKSPSYSSGYALRFPRIIRLRDDKGIDEIADLNQIKALYQKQKSNNSN